MSKTNPRLFRNASVQLLQRLRVWGQTHALPAVAVVFLCLCERTTPASLTRQLSLDVLPY